MPRQSTPRKAIIPIGPSIAYLPLSRNLFACIDSSDAEWLECYNWQVEWSKNSRTYYALRNINKDGKRTKIRLHAQIMGTAGRMITADHIVLGNGLDCRRANLRIATAREQRQNQGPGPCLSDRIERVNRLPRVNGRWARASI